MGALAVPGQLIPPFGRKGTRSSESQDAKNNEGRPGGLGRALKGQWLHKARATLRHSQFQRLLRLYEVLGPYSRQHLEFSKCMCVWVFCTYRLVL